MLKTKTETKEVGAIVGRFQVPYLHDAHKQLIQKVVDTHPRVLVFLGLSADICKGSFNNPLDFHARKIMLETEFPTIEVLYVKDQGNDEIWSKLLDQQISTVIGPGQKVVLYGSRDSFVPHYKGKHETQELVPSIFVSGRELRKNVGIKSKGTQEFREGACWLVENQWPSVKPTVDVAIVDLQKHKVLVCRKPNETLNRFVGGFAVTTTNSYEEDAVKELAEETHIKVNADDLVYLGSALIPDWRLRSERDKIKSSFFAARYDGAQLPVADDDIAEVRWIDFIDVTAELFIPEHAPLVALFNKNMAKRLYP